MASEVASEARSAPGRTAAALPAFAVGPVLGVAVLQVGLLSALSGRYGFHRDELYFMAAGHHLAWGYVDQPPLTPLLARGSTELFGDSPYGLRVVATLAAAAVVVVVAFIARELGGGRGPQALAAACVAVSGFVLAVGHMVSTATFDLLAWLVIAWLALRLLRTADGRWWLPLGVAVGVGAQNKYLVALLVAVLLVGVLAVGPRDALRGWWPVAGVLVAAAIALPTLVWQARHGWPQLDVARGIAEDDGTENRIGLIPGQLVFLSPVFIPIWIYGAVRLWRDADVRWARPLVVAYPLLLVAVLAIGGKPYYAFPLLIVLLAAGCQPLLERGLRARRGLVTAVALSLAVNAYLVLPLVPESGLGVPNKVDKEQGEQVGWPELADAVAAGWQQIPESDRPRAVVLANNYGEAGALDRYGPARGLPAPYSGHMAYADWRRPPDRADGPVLIVRQKDAAGTDRYFTDCREVGQVHNNHGVDNEEDGSRVVLCAGPHEIWSALWPRLRHYY
ncbi:ArnT family glycosyltransferase [Yinghuangia seranimata]|uniref:ArnT family glycosyltransferase n=1 Tax=Yinghuangia seranimata TaxID=408067 RepID=UPI00248BE203|nr:glycosyltransferase family 39 protein [Yinghuangia seranimata]MDI2129847.1 glycosyltransferase family 39 protein [Yinghuangia seranimata]